MADTILLSNGRISAEIALVGAELMSLKDGHAQEWLWQGDAASWPRRSPILFPVIGRSAGNALRHRGRVYPAANAHGFAPNSVFVIISRERASCRLRLESDAATRHVYPFHFQLDVAFTLDGSSIRQIATVTNTGRETMPASLGFHPGLRWPMPSGSAAGFAKEAHVVRFAREEPADVRRLVGGLLSTATFPSPVSNGLLMLSDDLFRDGAMVFDRLVSRSVWFGVPEQAGVCVDFPDLPHLGLWSLPAADFLCIEPWQGHACPEDFSGEILDKPGMIHLEPGESFSRRMTIGIGEPAPVMW